MHQTIPLSHHIEYRLLRLLEALMRLIPRSMALMLGALLGAVLYHLGVYRAIVKKNMDFVGLFEESKKRGIVKNLYRNTGRFFADFIRSSDNAPPYHVNNFQTAKSVFSRGKGSIIILAHFGNWEALASIFGMQLYDLNVLAKPMKNRLVEKWLFEKRLSAHVTPIYVSQALRKMMTVLRRGGIIAMLIDQYAGGQGSPSPFLGKNTSTVRTVAGLLHKTDCGIVFAYALLQKDGSYAVEIEEGPHLDVSRDDQEQFITAYQKAHNDVLSRWIAQHPDHYFGWFHRRFKDVISY